jgi:ribosomal protein S27AE
MNAICPRCGTVSLAGAQTTRFICKTCHLRFCNECQHWKVDRKQPYCARCGAYYSYPPSVVPWRIAAWVIYVPTAAALILTAFIPLQFWQLALVATLPSVIFTSAYLARLYQNTGLIQATRREAILLGRRALTLATIIYVVMTLGDQKALMIGLVIAVFLVLVGLAAQRMNTAVVQELQLNRSTWQTILSMSNQDVLLMRFPPARQAKAP